MLKVRNNDEVLITTGKDNGKRGKVIKVFIKTGKVIVGGLNMYKRHLKRRSEKEKSQIVSLEKPIAISNIQVVCPHCGQPTKIGFNSENEKKMRECKKCKKVF